MPLDPTLLDPALRARLQHADPGVRRVALMALADEQDEDGLPWLAAALDDLDAAVRAEAAQRLAGWDREIAVQALLRALRDTDGTVRLAAAAALSELQDPAAGPWLVKDAASTDAFVRSAVLRALRELRHPPAAIPAMEALIHADAAVRREAVGVLGWLKHLPALPALAALATRDGDEAVRRSACGALALASDEQAAANVRAALLAALADSAWTVREEAASTLGKRRWPDESAVIEALLQALADDYWQVRLRAARALGRLQARAAVAALGETLARHPISNLRKEAAIALGEIGDPTAMAFLEAAQFDTDPEVRKLAGMARTKLQRP